MSENIISPTPTIDIEILSPNNKDDILTTEEEVEVSYYKINSSRKH